MLGHAGYTRLAWLTGTQMGNGCTLYPFFPLVQAVTIHLVFPTLLLGMAAPTLLPGLAARMNWKQTMHLKQPLSLD